MRNQLAGAGLAESRLVFTITPAENTASTYTAQSDINGLLLLGANYETAVELLRELAEA